MLVYTHHRSLAKTVTRRSGRQLQFLLTDQRYSEYLGRIKSTPKERLINKPV